MPDVMFGVQLASIDRRLLVSAGLFIGGLLVCSRRGKNTDYRGGLLATDYLGLALCGVGLLLLVR